MEYSVVCSAGTLTADAAVANIRYCRREVRRIVSRLHVVRSRIMYIENKTDGLSGPARIGRVTYSKSGRTLRYAGLEFRTLDGRGFKANYRDVASGDEYWTEIRGAPERQTETDASR